MMDPIVTLLIAIVGAAGTVTVAYLVQRPKARADALQIYSQIQEGAARDALERIAALEKRCDEQDVTIESQAKRLNAQREQIAALISQLAEAKTADNAKSSIIIDMQIEINRLQREVKELRTRLALYESVPPSVSAA